MSDRLLFHADRFTFGGDLFRFSVIVYPPPVPTPDQDVFLVHDEYLVFKGDLLQYSLEGALTITIRGETVPGIKNKVRIERKLDGRAGARIDIADRLAVLNAPGGVRPRRGDEVVISYGPRILFGGHIYDPDVTLLMGSRRAHLSLSCVGYGARFDDVDVSNLDGARIIRLSDADSQARALVALLADEGFTVGTIATGAAPLLGDIRFKPIYNALSSLAQSGKGSVIIGQDRAVSVVDRAHSVDSGVVLTPENCETFALAIDPQHHRTHQTILGGQVLTVLTFAGDGATRRFPLEARTATFYDYFDPVDPNVRPTAAGDASDIGMRGKLALSTLAPISVFDPLVVGGFPTVGGAAPGVVFKETLPAASYVTSMGDDTTFEGQHYFFTIYSARPVRATHDTRRIAQPVPSVYVEGGATAYLTELTFTRTQVNPPFERFTGSQVRLQLHPTNDNVGPSAGPQLTAAARRDWGIVVKQGANIRKFPFGPDGTEPYRWNEPLSIAYIQSLDDGPIELVIVDRSNPNVDWDNLLVSASLQASTPPEPLVFDEGTSKTIDHMSLGGTELSLALDAGTWSSYATTHYTALLRHLESGQTWAITMNRRSGVRLFAVLDADVVSEIRSRLSETQFASTLIVVDRSVAGVSLANYGFFPQLGGGTPISVTGVDQLRLNGAEQDVGGAEDNWRFDVAAQSVDYVGATPPAAAAAIQVVAAGRWIVEATSGIVPRIERVAEFANLASIADGHEAAGGLVDLHRRPTEVIQAALGATLGIHVDEGTLVGVNQAMAAMAGVEHPEPDERWVCEGVTITSSGSLLHYELRLLRRAYESRSRVFWRRVTEGR